MPGIAVDMARRGADTARRSDTGADQATVGRLRQTAFAAAAETAIHRPLVARPFADPDRKQNDAYPAPAPI
jgi:hypothetical protein